MSCWSGNYLHGQVVALPPVIRYNDRIPQHLSESGGISSEQIVPDRHSYMTGHFRSLTIIANTRSFPVVGYDWYSVSLVVPVYISHYTFQLTSVIWNCFGRSSEGSCSSCFSSLSSHWDAGIIGPQQRCPWCSSGWTLFWKETWLLPTVVDSLLYNCSNP